MEIHHDMDKLNDELEKALEFKSPEEREQNYLTVNHGRYSVLKSDQMQEVDSTTVPALETMATMNKETEFVDSRLLAVNKALRNKDESTFQRVNDQSFED